MKRRGGSHRVARAATLSALAATTAACAWGSGTATGSAGPGRHAVRAPVLVLAVTASANEQLPMLPGRIRDRLQGLAERAHEPGAARVTVYVPGRPGVAVDLTPMRGNSVENNGPRREKAIAEALDRLSRTIATNPATVPGLDAIGLLDRAARDGGTAPLALLSSGVSTVPPLDLNRWGWPESTREVVDFLTARGQLPRYLRGRTVSFFFLGDVSAPQPELTTPTRALVARLYRDVCLAAGGVGCTVEPDAPSGRAGAATAPVPLVAVPGWEQPSPSVRSCRTVVRIPSAVLFDPDSAVLGPQADQALNPLVARLREAAGALRVELIRGHTSDAGPGDGVALSVARATAVARRLVVLGLPGTWIGRVDGVGEKEPVVPDRAVDGGPGPQAWLNRRVDITVIGRTCASGPAEGSTP